MNPDPSTRPASLRTFGVSQLVLVESSATSQIVRLEICEVAAATRPFGDVEDAEFAASVRQPSTNRAARRAVRGSARR